jgi:predicted phage terminase large subunit-like protein
VRIDVDKLNAGLCRECYSDFLNEFWAVIVPEPLRWNWHMMTMCDEVQALLERVFRGLPKLHDQVINVSPGTSKSLTVSVFSTPWAWTRMPSFRSINVSYAFPLAEELGQKARDVVNSDAYHALFPEVRLRDDFYKKSHFGNTRGGYRFAIGVDGQVTGRHAHLITVDDPLDPQQAVSALELEKTNRFLRNTLPSRKVDKAVTPTILVMQRLCVGDPTDLFLSRGKVRHVCLPAELGDNVKPPELKRHYAKVDGGPALMDPVRLGRAVLEEAKNEGQFIYAGQYLQRPVPEGGGMFHVSQFRYAESLPPWEQFSSVVRAWDKGGTTTGDYTVGVRLGRTHDDHYWVLDVVRGRWNSSARENVIDGTAESDGLDTLIALEKDPGAGGLESAENTMKRLQKLGHRVKLFPVGKSEGDKVARADPFSVKVNAGGVTLLKAPWNSLFVAEFETFDGKHGHDDQVDATSTAHRALWRGKKRVGGARSKRERFGRELRQTPKELLNAMAGLAGYRLRV